MKISGWLLQRELEPTQKQVALEFISLPVEMEEYTLLINKRPPVFMPEAVKTPCLINPRTGYTALNCLSMVDSKVVANEDKYFSSVSKHIEEPCRKTGDVLQLAKEWLKQVKQQWHDG